MEYTYHPMHMHIHAGCDYGSSMALNMYNASLLGMKYIWFTDHDTRMGLRQRRITGFVFDTDLVKTEDVGSHGFKLVNEKSDCRVNSSDKSLMINSASSDDAKWESSGVYFYSTGTRHTCSLAAELTLTIDLKNFDISEDSRLIFAVKLSQRPPDMKNAYMLYVMGSTDGLGGDHVQIVPLDYQKGTITMPVSKDVSCDLDIGGKDNAFDTLYIVLQTRNGAASCAELGDFAIYREKSGEALRKELQKVANRVGMSYGVNPFVSFEVSAAGEHKNCYGTNIPVIEYHNHNYKVTEKEAIEHIKNHNGIFAFNHPFAGSQFKRLGECDESARQQMLQKLFEDTAKTDALGATNIEVGFPMGRIFPFEYYLKLWDMLSVGGILLTGYGSSDCHRNNEGWFDGNNFVAYIGADNTLAEPLKAEVFVDALKKGRVYTGDPVKLKGNISFKTSQGAQMGSVIGNKESVCICFSAENLPAGSEFRLVENGEVIHTEKIDGDSFKYESMLNLKGKDIAFHRAELWEDGRCIMLTNPIYLVSSGFLTEHKNDVRILERYEGI